MVVRQGRVERRWSWYELPRFWNGEVESGEIDWVAGTTAHLRQAVHRQMVADVPVGAFLSGGLDSSAVGLCPRAQSRYPLLHHRNGRRPGGWRCG